MIFLRAIREWVWPLLDPPTPEEKARQDGEQHATEQRVRAIALRRDVGVAIDEARRMVDSEDDRRRSTDQKAATYLPLVAALIPLSLAMASALWEKKSVGAPGWANLPLLGLAVAYAAAAGIWAFKVLEVSNWHEVGLKNFENVWMTSRPGANLVRRLLLNARLNNAPINRKVDRIRMAHAFLLRAFLTFTLILGVNIAWFFVSLLIVALARPASPAIASAEQAIAAVATVDRVADRMRIMPGWAAIDAECLSRQSRRLSTEVSAVSTLAPASASRVLHVAGKERAAAMDGILRCGRHTVGRVTAWYVPSRLPSAAQASPLEPPVTSGVDVREIDRLWPPSAVNASATRLPPTLLRQIVRLTTPRGRTVGLVATEATPGLLSY